MNKELNKLISNKKYNKIFILCGKKSFKNTNAKEYFLQSFKNKKLKIFYKKLLLPEFKELKIISKNLKKFKPDLLLAVGGGCVLDYAKIANVININFKSGKLIKNSEHPVTNKFTKLVAIPTTAGSGAEVTSNAVIYLNGIKYSIEHKNLVPDYFFLVPKFIITTPKKIKSSAGFDAYAQAIESLLAVKSNEISVKYAIKGLEKVNLNLVNYYNNPNLKNSLNIAKGANFSGKAISISKTTLPHAISYPFSYHYNLSHGHSVSLFFEKLIRYNFENISKSNTNFDLGKRFKIIFKILKVRNIDGFIKKTLELKKKIGLEDNLKKLNINLDNDKNKILKGINFLRLNNNPIKITPEKIFRILKK